MGIAFVSDRVVDASWPLAPKAPLAGRMQAEAYGFEMPQSDAKSARRSRVDRAPKSKTRRSSTPGPRYSVGLSSTVANQVERYAETADTSISKAIAALVRLGLESQANRKREFFKKLKENLAKDDLNEQDRIVDEFRTLILGR